jgi:hypothetical protein
MGRVPVPVGQGGRGGRRTHAHGGPTFSITKSGLVSATMRHAAALSSVRMEPVRSETTHSTKGSVSRARMPRGSFQGMKAGGSDTSSSTSAAAAVKKAEFTRLTIPKVNPTALQEK